MFTSQTADSQAGALADAAALKAAMITDGYLVKLFKAGFNPNDRNVAADFAAHECDFTGYASVSVGGSGRLWSALLVDAQGNIGFVSPSCFFQATDAVSPNQAGGYWIEKTAGGVYRYNAFPVPVDFTAALKFLDAILFESASVAGYATVNN